MMNYVAWGMSVMIAVLILQDFINVEKNRKQ